MAHAAHEYPETWFEGADLIDVDQALSELGYSRTLRAGCVHWLLTGEEASRVAEYRRMLRRVLQGGRLETPIIHGLTSSLVAAAA